MLPNKLQREGKILLVDDDPGLLRLLSIRLRAEGYEVEAVESAYKALGALRQFSPDLVITDLRMDKMDGIGLLKELQTKSPGLRAMKYLIQFLIMLLPYQCYLALSPPMR